MQNESSRPGFFAAFFGFKRMVSPFFITILYFVGLITIVLAIGFALWRGPQSMPAMPMLSLPDIAQMILGYVAILLCGLLAILIWRFYCELLIVLFGIFNRLGDIKEALEKPALAAESAARVQSTIAPIPAPPVDPEPSAAEVVATEPAKEEVVETEVFEAEPVAEEVVEAENVEAEVVEETASAEPAAEDASAQTEEAQGEVIALPDESNDVAKENGPASDDATSTNEPTDSDSQDTKD